MKVRLSIAVALTILLLGVLIASFDGVMQRRALDEQRVVIRQRVLNAASEVNDESIKMQVEDTSVSTAELPASPPGKPRLTRVLSRDAAMATFKRTYEPDYFKLRRDLLIGNLQNRFEWIPILDIRGPGSYELANLYKELGDLEGARNHFWRVMEYGCKLPLI